MNLIVFKTDTGKYSVRPPMWGCAFDRKGNLLEKECRNLALFLKEEHANIFVEAMKGRDE